MCSGVWRCVEVCFYVSIVDVWHITCVYERVHVRERFSVCVCVCCVCEGEERMWRVCTLANGQQWCYRVLVPDGDEQSPR